MAYEMVMPYHLHMPSYFLETFTEYPYVINNHYIPDAQFPEFGERELVQKNADFIARHSLLYYYRGD